MESVTNRIAELQAELSRIKAENREKARQAKRERRWISVTKSLPEKVRVLAWANDELHFCWYADEKFYDYDGTWYYTDKDRVESVSHWMPKDWMYSRELPSYGPGIKNRIIYLWKLFTQGATNMAHDLRPRGWSTTAQLSKKPSFFYNSKTGEIMTGGPEHVNAPFGYEKIVCTKAYEAEKWSERQRQWDKRKHAQLQEQRGGIEESMHAEIRSELHHRMANARNNVNREFLRRALENSDRKPNPWKYERESYMHAEGFEDRH